MNSGNWIELAALLVTIIGGGGVSISKLTRIAVTIEAAGKTLEQLGKTLEALGSVVQAHETRITVLEQPARALQNKP